MERAVFSGTVRALGIAFYARFLCFVQGMQARTDLLSCALTDTSSCGRPCAGQHPLVGTADILCQLLPHRHEKQDQ
jgi:hypothetical protein